MTTVRFMSEKFLYWVPPHIFIQHLVFMAVFDWILGWCQFTPPGVPIHPSSANSPRPVVNFIFFNTTKTEVPEVLKMSRVELLCIALTHICNNLAASMTSLEAIKKRGANSPRSPLHFVKKFSSCSGSGSGRPTVHHPRWGKTNRSCVCVCVRRCCSYLNNSFIWALNAAGSVICIVDSERAFQSFTACGKKWVGLFVDVLWWLWWNKWFAVEIPGETSYRVQLGFGLGRLGDLHRLSGTGRSG